MPKTITDGFTPYIGTKEYNGIIADIQKWFYNTKDLVRAPWCASSVSYFANEVGILDQIGGKNDNVCNMENAARKAWMKGSKGKFLRREDITKGTTIPRGTICFMLWSGEMKVDNPHKHATTVNKDFTWKGSGYFEALGGNQDDMIKVCNYSQAKIHALFIPDYGKPEHKTVRYGDSGYEVRDMQNALIQTGFAEITGERLTATGKFGKRTLGTVAGFQVVTRIPADGICGPITWDMLDYLSARPETNAKALTDVYVRQGPGPGFKSVGVVKEGEAIVYTSPVEDWIYIPSKNGWSKALYFELT